MPQTAAQHEAVKITIDQSVGGHEGGRHASGGEAEGRVREGRPEALADGIDGELAHFACSFSGLPWSFRRPLLLTLRWRAISP